MYLLGSIEHKYISLKLIELTPRNTYYLVLQYYLMLQLVTEVGFEPTPPSKNLFSIEIFEQTDNSENNDNLGNRDIFDNEPESDSEFSLSDTDDDSLSITSVISDTDNDSLSITSVIPEVTNSTSLKAPNS